MRLTARRLWAGVWLASACRSAPVPAPPTNTAVPAPTVPVVIPRVTPAPRAATAQYRFEVANTGDTTFAFVAPTTPWLLRGQLGIVVDPRRRDEMVARFETLGRTGDTVIAMITGQTRKVSRDHVVVLTPPVTGIATSTVTTPMRRVPMFRQRGFWIGILTGGALGAGAAVVAR